MIHKTSHHIRLFREQLPLPHIMVDITAVTFYFLTPIFFLHSTISDNKIPGVTNENFRDLPNLVILWAYTHWWIHH